MQVEAIYNQGTIQFVHPLRLKHDHMTGGHRAR